MISVEKLKQKFGAGGVFVLVVVLLLVASFMLYRESADPNALPDMVSFVCVESGKIYKLDRHDVNTIPMPNPDTGDRTLMPCVQDGAGFKVDAHYAAALPRLKERNHYVDPKTLQVKTMQ